MPFMTMIDPKYLAETLQYRYTAIDIPIHPRTGLVQNVWFDITIEKRKEVFAQQGYYPEYDIPALEYRMQRAAKRGLLKGFVKGIANIFTGGAITAIETIQRLT